jgi:hypothetical protein
MINKENIYNRILKIIEFYNIDGVQGLAKVLGYNSAEKLYRLKRLKNASPSFNMILDFTNKFENLNIRWFLTGKGEIEYVFGNKANTEFKKLNITIRKEEEELALKLFLNQVIQLFDLKFNEQKLKNDEIHRLLIEKIIKNYK